MKLTRKSIGRIAASFVATAMLATMAIVPASAEGTNSALEVEGKSVSFNKVINMSNAAGAGVPKADFTFTVTDGTGDADTQIVDEDDVTPGVQITANNYATGTATQSTKVDIDFNVGAFTVPGEYTYILNEVDPQIPGMSYDSNAYTLEVTVVNANADDPDGTYKILGATLTKTGEGSAKTDTITNTYSTYDLTLDKVVTGNFGDKTQDFTFTVSFTTNNENATSFMNGTNVVNFVDGSAPVEVTLKDGENVKFSGLPADVTYTIVEKEATDYTTTIAGTGVNSSDDKTANGDVKVDGSAQDVTVTYTNSRDTTAPTGIMMDIAPYAVLVVIAAAGCFIFLRKRHAKED